MTPEAELVGSSGRHVAGKELALALLFLVPAMLLLVVWLVYPVVFTVVRSLFDAAGGSFIGLENYGEMFTNDSTLTAIKNNAVWVVVGPTLVTAVGLVFAVLTERIPFDRAFKAIVFMPMAISFLASGVIFRLVYESDPDRGVLNAMVTAVEDVFREPGRYPGGRPVDPEQLTVEGDGFISDALFSTGDTAELGLIGIRPALVDEEAQPAEVPAPPSDGLSGVVWLDFTAGGGSERGVIDAGEVGLVGVNIEAVSADGSVAGRASTDDAGRFLIDGLDPGEYRLRLTGSAFREPFGGYEWLGPTLVTPAVIGSFIWIWAGFAMVLIAAGLAAIPRETMEAARVDGANEWQVFQRVTVPLLRPVLLVVLVTLVINVLKIFDLVLIIPPGSVQDDATVLALEMWRVSFGGAQDQGLGSALGVFLFLLVLPAMAFNLRRFRAEEQ